MSSFSLSNNIIVQKSQIRYCSSSFWILESMFHAFGINLFGLFAQVPICIQNLGTRIQQENRVRKLRFIAILGDWQRSVLLEKIVQNEKQAINKKFHVLFIYIDFLLSVLNDIFENHSIQVENKSFCYDTNRQNKMYRYTSITDGEFKDKISNSMPV